MTNHTSTVTIDCGRCRVPLQGPSNPKPHDILTCPQCGGQIETEKAIEQARNLIIAQVNKDIKEVFRKAGFK
jgi:Zn finger protein HypA/HybF involved in hydrogenase expression